MSRVGNQPIVLADGVKVNISPGKLEFAGPMGKLTSPLLPGINAEMKDNQLTLTRSDNSKEH